VDGTQVTGEVSEERVAPHPISAWEWAARGLSATFILIAVWYTIGPWSVNEGGTSFGCGSPFMGRYRSAGDPMAGGSWACHLQTHNRMVIALIAWCAGVLLAVVSIFLGMRTYRRAVTANSR
jgi:hypothetical protein